MSKLGETLFTRALKEVIAEDLKALDAVIEEDIEVLSHIGNPEKLIGKPYEEWTPQDKQRLAQIYGSDDNTLDKFIFKREYEDVLEKERALEEG